MKRETCSLFRGVVCAVLLLLTLAVFAQVPKGAITGVVTDPTGAVIANAHVELAGPDGHAQSTTTDRQGRYAFSALAAGEYHLQITAQGFAVYEATSLQVTTAAVTHNATMDVAAVQEQVTVADTKPMDVAPENNAGAIVLKGEDLKVLSDDPDDLAEDLQALAGPAAGPNGGEIFVDGFSGGKLPPKSSIREIRINQNPFSSEYDRLGYGRIEILTKPGADKFRGDIMFNFGDSIFNSRNPFVAEKPDYQRRMFDANFGGPLGKKASFMVEVERRDIEETAIINAQVLDSNFVVTPFQQAVLTPTTNTEISGRLDYQLSTNNTLVARYEWETRTGENSGLDTYSLPTRAYNSDSTEHVLQITETAVLTPRTIHETRFQYRRDNSNSTALNSDPVTQVADAFTGGGASVGISGTTDNHWELTDVLSLSRNRHMIKVGGRIRGTLQSNNSTSNYNGLFTFTGSACRPSLIVDGACPQGAQVWTSMDAYQVTLMGLQQGLTMQQIRALDGGPSQFSITVGNPIADVSQVDTGIFFQDDWRLHQQFTLSAGFRYETQNNIGDRRDFAPRLGFAWAPSRKGNQQPIAVIRGGFGIFYDRVSEGLTLNALRLDGFHQTQYVIPYPDFYPDIPSMDQFSQYALQTAIRTKSNALRAPYVMQSAVSLERQLAKNVTLSLTYTNSRGLHQLRSRNINAYLPGTYDPITDTGIRPYSGGDIYQYESTGSFRQNQVMMNVNGRISRRLNVFGFYVWSKAQSDTDGSGSFPANQYDFTGEYSRAGFDIHHRVFVGGSFDMPYGFSLNPMIVANSGAPFNITLGTDKNGDSLFNDRPTWATDFTRPSVIVTPYGAFDTDPIAGQTFIPRNLGNGRGQFFVNLRLSKVFSFGGEKSEKTAQAPDTSQRRGPMIVGPVGGHGHGHGGGMGRLPGGNSGNGRYSLTFSVSARNLLNTVNLGSPIGNLSSSRFGESIALGRGGFGGSASANRAIEFQTRFSF